MMTVKAGPTCVTMGVGQCMDQDNDGYGEGAYPTGSLDCNEGDANINPGAQEQCNSVDDDCDNRIDECPPPATSMQRQPL